MAELTLERLAELELAIGSEYDGELHLHETTARELLAAARRDADVRTLDDWADERPGCAPFMTIPGINEEWLCCRLVQGDYVDIHRGDSALEARAKAAAWVRKQGIESGKGGDNV